jgi:hypothetical protein
MTTADSKRVILLWAAIRGQGMTQMFLQFKDEATSEIESLGVRMNFAMACEQMTKTVYTSDKGIIVVLDGEQEIVQAFYSEGAPCRDEDGKGLRIVCEYIKDRFVLHDCGDPRCTACKKVKAPQYADDARWTMQNAETELKRVLSLWDMESIFL